MIKTTKGSGKGSAKGSGKGNSGAVSQKGLRLPGWQSKKKEKEDEVSLDNASVTSFTSLLWTSSPWFTSQV